MEGMLSFHWAFHLLVGVTGEYLLDIHSEHAQTFRMEAK